MIVSDIMQCCVVTVTPDTTVSEAIRLAGERGIRHLPVLEGDRLVGIVSDRDLKKVAGETAALALVRVRSIMTTMVFTTAPTFTVEEAARMMMRERISALPVTVAGQLVGIVTETDVVRLFVRALGADEPSSRFDVALGCGHGSIGDVVAVVERAGAPIVSVMTLATPGGGREAIVRVGTMTPAAAIRALTGKGYRVRDAACGSCDPRRDPPRRGARLP
jgi:acetoin utilization protein AcuB